MFALTAGSRWSAKHAAIHGEWEQLDIHTMIEVVGDAGDKRERFSGPGAQVGSSAHFVIADVGPLVSLALATLGDPAMMAKQASYLDLLEAVGHPIEKSSIRSNSNASIAATGWKPPSLRIGSSDIPFRRPRWSPPWVATWQSAARKVNTAMAVAKAN